jgi:hypothetical protein
LITLTADALSQEKEPILSSRHTSWDFRRLVKERLTLNVPLMTEDDTVAAAKFFNDTIQWKSWTATPEHESPVKAYHCPIIIKQKNWRKKKTP